MSLRTYPLITHPAFLSFVETSRLQLELFPDTPAASVPTHRPDIQEVSDIGRYLGISPLLIRGMIRSKNKHYRSFNFKKRSGDIREIDAPRTFLKVVQWWIYDTILKNVEPSAHSFGFVRGRSFVDNAKFHHGATYLLNVDVKNFFPSIDILQVEKIFSSFGYRTSIARALADLCTFKHVLPQGAPTSPALANLFMAECDSELNEVAAEYGLRFSRYADDITMSGPDKIPLEVLHKIRTILARRHLKLNESKTHFMGRNQRKEVTGLVLGADGVGFSRDFLNSARGWLHQARLNPHDHKQALDRIKGTVAMIDYVGGRGAERVVELGRNAILAIESSFFTEPPSLPAP